MNVLELDGVEYLVAVRGETQWVRNLRAAGECELLSKGRVRKVAATEVPVADRERILSGYRRRWASTRPFFTRLPSDADHPVFALQAA